MDGQAQAYLTDGTPIPEDQLDDAIRSGLANFRPDDLVSVTGPTGVHQQVKGSEVSDFLASGFQVEAPTRALERERYQEFGTVGQAAIAAGEGLARGLTVGLSDVAAGAIGGQEYAERAAARREVQSPFAFAGEAVGTVAPLLLTGGGSAVARGAATVGALPRGVAALGGAAERAVAGRLGEGLAARAVGAAAGGAVEGALYGAGYGAGEVALHPELQDPAKAAEYLMGAVVSGALFGGVVAGGAGALAGAARTARAALTEGPLPLPSMPSAPSLAGFAERRAVKAVSGGFKRYADDLVERGGGVGAEGNRVGRKLLDADIPLRDPVEATRALSVKVDESLGRMKEVLSQVDRDVDVAAVIARGDEQVAALRARNSTVADQAADAVEQEVSRLRRVVFPEENGLPVPGGKRYSVNDWWQARKDLDANIRWNRRQGLSESEKALRDLRSSFEDQLEATIESGASAEQKAVWRTAKEDYGDFLAAKNAADNLAKARGKNRTFGLTDYLAGGSSAGALIVGAITGSPAAMAAGLASQGGAAVINKFFREQGSGILAKFADRVAKGRAATKMAATAMVTKKKPAPPLPLVGRRPARVAVPVAMAGKRLAERFWDSAEQVRENEDPERLAPKMEEVTRGLTPELALNVSRQTAAANAYLAAKLPKGASEIGATLTPGADPEQVSPEEMRRFLRIVDALEDPDSVLEDVAAGKVDIDQLEALKLLSPQRWQDLRTDVIEAASALEEPIPYQRRIMLGVLFDFDSDPSLTREFQQVMQAASVVSAPPPPPPPKKGAQLSKDFSADLAPSTDKV